MKLPENFKPNYNLTEELERLRDDTSQLALKHFFERLKTARLLVPCQGDHMNVAVIETPEGERFLPAFTCEEELRKSFAAWERIAVMPIDILKHIVTDLPQQLTGVVIDPFGTSLALKQPQLRELDSLTEGMSVQRTDHEEPLHLEPLHRYPVGLPAALTALFMKHPEVSRAWLLSARKSQKHKPHKLFLIEFRGDRRLLFPEVARAVEPFMTAGESFELMKADWELAQQATKKAAPFYVRPAAHN